MANKLQWPPSFWTSLKGQHCQSLPKLNLMKDLLGFTSQPWAHPIIAFLLITSLIFLQHFAVLNAGVTEALLRALQKYHFA